MSTQTNRYVASDDIDTLVRCLLQAKQTIEKIQSQLRTAPTPDDRIERYDLESAQRQIRELGNSVRTSCRDAMTALIDLGFDVDFTILKAS